jgi:hypothetical protein
MCLSTTPSTNTMSYAYVLTLQLRPPPAPTALERGRNAAEKTGLVLHAALLATLALLITSTTVRYHACSINKLLFPRTTACALSLAACTQADREAS